MKAIDNVDNERDVEMFRMPNISYKDYKLY
jgi:hypothetical protein